MTTSYPPVIDEESHLLLDHRRTSARDNFARTTLEEYESLGVTVIENEEHEPVVLHELSGPVIRGEDTVERRDSLLDVISMVTDETNDVTDLPHPDDVGVGQATIANEIASMTKNLVGCGALSLSSGIARCANAPLAAMAGNLWIALFGVIFGYYCWLIGKVCGLVGRTTYRGIWQETVGHKGAVFVSIANALKAALADLAYATILSDTLKSLLASVGFVQVPRVACLLAVTLVAILPLCLLKNLHVLAPFSVLGTAGILCTCGAMAIRYLDGSYLPGGRYYEDIKPSYQPYFGTTNQVWSTGILPFVCMVYEAYVMHYNSARFYAELKDRSLPRFGIAVGSSFGISAMLYMAISTFGYLTFGGNSSGYILNNYSPYDPLATVSRLAVGLSTLTAYPIVFFGVRDGVLDMFEVPLHEQTEKKLNSLTFVLLTLLTVTAIFVTDLGLINAVGGGLVATAIVFVFPTIMFTNAIRQMRQDPDKSRSSMEVEAADMREVVLSIVLTGIGVALGFIGAYTAVAGISPSSLER